MIHRHRPRRMKSCILPIKSEYAMIGRHYVGSCKCRILARKSVRTLIRDNGITVAELDILPTKSISPIVCWHGADRQQRSVLSIQSERTVFGSKYMLPEEISVLATG